MPPFELSVPFLLLAQIAAILLVSRVLGVAMRWLGQPLVLAEMVAGIVLGPSLLGWLWPQAFGALFPESSLAVLKLLSQLGLVLFMFLVGLEFDPELLRGKRRASALISSVSILLPFTLGVASASWLRDEYSPARVAFLPFSLFLGTALSVTAFPVLARILSELGLMASRVGVIAIGCAAVGDVTAWCLLAFVVAITNSQGLGEAFQTMALTVAFSLGMLLLARPLLSRVGTWVSGRGGLTLPVLAGVVLLLIASSAATAAIGVHALFGAFLCGVALPKENGLSRALAKKFEFLAVVLLLPLFFAYSGLRTEIGLLSGWAQWMVAFGLTLLATLGKFGGSALAARLTGIGWREASAIGVLMNTRGLMELIVLNIGMDLGVITPTLFTILVMMALVTTLATTPILRWVYPARLRTG